MAVGDAGEPSASEHRTHGADAPTHLGGYPNQGYGWPGYGGPGYGGPGYGGPGYGGPGYGGPGYGGPGYGGPGYGGQVEHPQGTTVLILGVCSLVLCQILAPFAWSMGNKALKEIDRDPLRYSNRSNVNTGRILGIVGTVLLGVYVLIVGAYLVVLVAALGSSSTS